MPVNRNQRTAFMWKLLITGLFKGWMVQAVPTEYGSGDSTRTRMKCMMSTTRNNASASMLNDLRNADWVVENQHGLIRASCVFALDPGDVYSVDSVKISSSQLSRTQVR